MVKLNNLKILVISAFVVYYSILIKQAIKYHYKYQQKVIEKINNLMLNSNFF
jgi:hypothetical protein